MSIKPLRHSDCEDSKAQSAISFDLAIIISALQKTTAKSSEVNSNKMATPGEHIKLLYPSTLFDSSPSFSHVAAFSTPVRMVCCAGQVGADVNGKAAEGLEAQVRLAFQNLKECLAAADASLRDLVKITFYIAGWNQEMTLEFGKPLMEFLTDKLGVSPTIHFDLGCVIGEVGVAF